MKKYWKIVLVIVLLGGAVVLYSAVPRKPDVGTSKDRIVRDDIISELRVFKILKEDISEEKAKQYQIQFDDSLKLLDDGLAQVQKQGTQALFNIYWPLIGLGSIHRTVGDYKKAEDAFLYAHEIQPGAFVPLGNLGELYNRTYKDYPKALEYYQRAVAVEGIDQGYLDTYYSDMYDIVRYRMNDEKGAEQLLIDGIKLNPEDTNIIAFLALHYRQLNRIDEAISRYKELLAKKPDSKVAQDALKSLGVL